MHHWTFFLKEKVKLKTKLNKMIGSMGGKENLELGLPAAKPQIFCEADS
jgi:hypothetical protein